MASPQRTAFIDLVLVLATITAAWALSKWLLYPALGVPDSAPLILRPMTGFVAAWVLLRWRGQGWDALGLRTPDPWWLMVAGGVALYLVNMALAKWAVPPLAQWLHAQPQPFFLGYVRGNAVAFLGWLTIGVVVGGLFEELLFRGFLLNRVAELCGGGPAALAAGIVAQAAIFGLLHWYAGAFGVVYAATFALANGVFYLVVRRNLWPLIVVHAVWNSVSIWGIYTR